MKITKMIKLIYLLYSVYILFIIEITNLNILYMIPSVLLLWGSYFMFILGYSYKKCPYKFSFILHQKEEIKFLSTSQKRFIFGIIMIFFSIIVVKFYTGQTPIMLVRNLLNNNSVYAEYQKYFASNNLQAFSISKIPFIIMLFLIKFVLIISYLNFNFKKNKFIYLSVITISFLYIGIARGTNFEMFELFMLYLFISLSKLEKNNISLINKYLKLFILGVIIIFIFNVVVSNRGVELGRYISQDIKINSNSFIITYMPLLGNLLISIFDYFGFGFFYISSFINRLIFSNLLYAIGILFPFGTKIIDSSNLIEYMSAIIDMGARWHPDATGFINQYGLIGFFLICFLLGVCSKKIILSVQISSVLKKLILYLIFIQFISFPVGNFLVISSSNKLIVFTSFILYFLDKKKIYRI